MSKFRLWKHKLLKQIFTPPHYTLPFLTLYFQSTLLHIQTVGPPFYCCSLNSTYTYTHCSLDTSRPALTAPSSDVGDILALSSIHFLNSLSTRSSLLFLGSHV